jgi:cytochrome c biogenesis protein CcdA
LSETLAAAFLLAGVVFLAGAAGIPATIAGNTVSAPNRSARVFAGILGVLMVAWGVFSVLPRSSPFTVEKVQPLPLAGSRCAETVQVEVLITAKNGPGDVTYFLSYVASPAPPPLVHTSRFVRTPGGPSTQAFGPFGIRLPRHRPNGGFVRIRGYSPSMLEGRASVGPCKSAAAASVRR